MKACTNQRIGKELWTRENFISIIIFMFMFMSSMELQILNQFHRTECRRVDAANINLREGVIPLISADDDVQFY